MKPQSLLLGPRLGQASPVSRLSHPFTPLPSGHEEKGLPLTFSGSPSLQLLRTLWGLACGEGGLLDQGFCCKKNVDWVMCGLVHGTVGCMACWLGAGVVGLGMGKDAGICSALALGLAVRIHKT